MDLEISADRNINSHLLAVKVKMTYLPKQSSLEITRQNTT
jgi:hypothetical protein